MKKTLTIIAGSGITHAIQMSGAGFDTENTWWEVEYIIKGEVMERLTRDDSAHKEGEPYFYLAVDTTGWKSGTVMIRISSYIEDPLHQYDVNVGGILEDGVRKEITDILPGWRIIQ